MSNLQKIIEQSFLVLETKYEVSYFRKDTKTKLIEAFSQTEEPPYIYLGYKRSESLSKLMNRMIKGCDKPYGIEWRNWLLLTNDSFLCTRCKSAFNLSSKSSEDKNYCISCATKKVTDYRKTNRQFIYDYLKANHCVDCGETNPIVLEFDHKDPDLKLFNLGDSKSYSLDKIKNEITKCDVVCANCHRVRTAKTYNWYSDLV
jgi:hypothetical protein